VDSETKSPLILWHFLSLDAPTAAAVWTAFIPIANGVRLPWTAPLSMAIAVWMLYAADRLLDTEELEPRHHFHHAHRGAFITGIVLASVILAFLLPRMPIESIHLYLILGGLVFGYFVVIHATRSAHRLPKELAVGVCFAAAVFIPTVSRRPDLRLPLIPPALLFAVLCSLNCLFIYMWEHAEAPSNHPPHWTTSFALRHLTLFAVINTAASLALAIFDRRAPWPIPAAIALSTALLLALHLRRKSHFVLTLRASADLVLLTPLIFITLV
jgi:cell division protein FtsW (lipid II flippase)